MRHRDALGRELHVGETVNCPDGDVAQVYVLGRSLAGESVALVTANSDTDVTRHLSREVVAVRQVRR